MSWSSGDTLLGVGWRPEIAGVALSRPDIGFVEVVAESLIRSGHSRPLPLPLPMALKTLVDRGVVVIPHGVSMSLGGAEPVEAWRVGSLAALAQRLRAPVVSEHLAFVRCAGRAAGHLLPVCRTRSSIDLIVANVRSAQADLPVPLALEPIAALFDWPGAEMDEAAFVTEILERTDAQLLLDVANVFVNSRNFGYDPIGLIDRLPLERLAYVHIAGGIEHDGLWHDTHAAAVWPEALDLLTYVVSRAGPVRVLLERDGDFAPDEGLEAELDAVSRAAFIDPAVAVAGRRTKVTAAAQTGGIDLPTGIEPDHDRRQPVRDAQGQLIDALVAGGDVPDGFDSGRVKAAAVALLQKRAREAANEWPHLARVCAGGFVREFMVWADGRPRCGSARDDGLAFALFCHPLLDDDDAVMERLDAEMDCGSRGRGRLRYVDFKVDHLPGSGATVVAVRAGSRWRRFVIGR